MAIETGWVNIFLSKFPSKISFITKITSIPAKRGSVGKYISIGKPSAISLKGIDNGTEKTMPNISLSKAKNAAKTSKIATGNKLK